MSASTVVVILGAVAALVTVGWFAFARKVPERAASHPPDPLERDDRDEGAAAGAEGQTVVADGSISPGRPGPTTGDTAASERPAD